MKYIDLILLALLCVASCSSPAAQQLRAERYATSLARDALAEGDLKAEDLPDIIGAARFAAGGLRDGAVTAESADAMGALIRQRFDVEGYAATFLDIILTEAVIASMDSDGGLDGAESAAALLDGIADGLEKLVPTG